ncbi:MAG: class I SAM-dependent methyltransferase [Terracidiphilus sp.]
MPTLKAIRLKGQSKVYALLMRLGLENIIVSFWKLKGQNVDYLRKKSLAERFDSIYKNHVWTGRREGESASGTGSTILAARQVSNELPNLLDRIGAESLLDLGCGKYYWMRNVNFRQLYIGADIVASVIEENQAKFQDDRHRFELLDGCVDPIPDADAVLCREVIFHLSFQDAMRLLRNIKRSNAKHFICTTDPAKKVNIDVPSGAWRDVNLEMEPYALGPPLATINDPVPDNSGRVLGVWSIASLPS